MSEKKKTELHITDSQWQILEVLWSAGEPVSTSRIRQELMKSGTDWKNNTIHTFLTRLAESGVVDFTGGTPKRFYPCYSREECSRTENRSFLQKVYKGSVKNMISAFLSDGSLSESEMEEIRELLKNDEK